MRVWCSPPRGPRGGKSELKGHSIDVNDGADIDRLRELDRRGFRFNADGQKDVTWRGIANVLRIDLTPLDKQMIAFRDKIVNLVGGCLQEVPMNEREAWLERVKEDVASFSIMARRP